MHTDSDSGMNSKSACLKPVHIPYILGIMWFNDSFCQFSKQTTLLARWKAISFKVLYKEHGKNDRKTSEENAPLKANDTW